MTDKQRRKFLLGLASLPFVPVFLGKAAKAVLAESRPRPLKERSFGGQFEFDNHFLQIDGDWSDTGRELLVQKGSLTYRQLVTQRRHPNGNSYFQGGTTTGELNLNCVIAPVVIMDRFWEVYSDVTKPRPLTLVVQRGVGMLPRTWYRMKNVTITNQGVVVRAKHVAVIASISMNFTEMEFCSEMQAAFYNPALGEPHGD